MTPDDDTDATLGAELDQVTARPVSAMPWPSRGVAVACVVCPTVKLVVLAVTVTDDTGATGAVVTVIPSEPLLPSLAAVTVAVPTPTACT